jgi:hypothetical protein
MLNFFEISGYGNPQAILFQNWVDRQKCPACGSQMSQKSPENAKVWVGSSGTKWKDILTNIDGLLFHERVVEVITAEGLEGFRAHPIEIEKIESKKMSTQHVPQYYFIEIKGKIDVDLDEIDEQGGSVCPLCFTRNPSKDSLYRWSPKRLLPMIETWDGSDFLKVRNLASAHKYCSKRFVDLASRNKWTNFKFGQSIPGVGLWEKAPEKGLSYLDADWFEKLSIRVKANNPDLFDK